MTRRRPSGLAVFCALVFAFLYVPILVVIVNSVNADEHLIGWGGFTLDWYRDAFSDERVRSDFATSVQVAVLSTVLSLAIAVAGSLWYRRSRRRARALFDATTYMRIILPEVVMAIGLFLLLLQFDVPLGLWTIVIAHVVFNSAYATLVIQARVATLSGDLEEAAADLGAPPRRVFWRVTLPLLTPAILVAGLLCLTFSFDNVVSSLFLGGTEAETLPVLLLGLTRVRVTPEVNAISTALMLMTIVTFALAALVTSIRGAAGVGGRR
jgi:ABC-type spermidine/putrescine transport system permease subunit II